MDPDGWTVGGLGYGAAHLGGGPQRQWRGYTRGMASDGDPFERLERLLFRPVSTRPDWLKAWRHEAQHLLFLARRAVDDEDDELLQELEDQAQEMADMVEARFTAEGL